MTILSGNLSARDPAFSSNDATKPHHRRSDSGLRLTCSGLFGTVSTRPHISRFTKT